jgi:uncharacterized protein (DUF58 family)
LSFECWAVEGMEKFDQLQVPTLPMKPPPQVPAQQSQLKTQNSKLKTQNLSTTSVTLTREGRYWLFLSLVLLFLGMYKGVNLLCVLAYVMLVSLLLNVLLGRRGLPLLRAMRRIGEPAFAGEPFPVELRAVNTGKKVLFGIELEDHEPDRTAFAFATRLDPGKMLIHRRETIVHSRGRYRWGTLEAVSVYPFGLAQRRYQTVDEEEILILPRLGRLHRGRLRRLLLSAGQVYVPTRRQARRHPTAQAEFHGLRAFRSGDSPRWIHWRTSARCGELMVREFEDVPTDNLILVVDPFQIDGLESIISFTATVAWEWCRQKGDHFVLAVASASPMVIGGTTGIEHSLRMLEALAGIQGEDNPDSAPMLERLAAEPLPPASIIAVSSRDPTPLQTAVSQRLHRPALGLGIEQISVGDFYEAPLPPGGNGYAN